jgi:hypothetical protein
MMKTELPKQIIELAEKILSQDLNVIEGSRKMVNIRAEFQMYDSNVFDLFRAIDSETDHIVLDESARVLMSPSRFEKNLFEITDCETYYRKLVDEACRRIIELGNPI